MAKNSRNSDQVPIADDSEIGVDREVLWQTADKLRGTVGAAEVEDDGEPFDEKMDRLTAELHEQFGESRKLKKAIQKNLKGLGFPS